MYGAGFKEALLLQVSFQLVEVIEEFLLSRYIDLLHALLISNSRREILQIFGRYVTSTQREDNTRTHTHTQTHTHTERERERERVRISCY
jgi:hypothetical protein